MSELQHRPEIDGLRAISITTVVLFHAGLPFCPGGYVGVDSFFVVSGFLITSLILDEMTRTGTVNFSRFYARRMRRLFPSALVVLLATLSAGLLLLRPDGEQQSLAKSGIAALAFVSNIHFSRDVGYFDGPADAQPLLHTWSLAVEEQFYLVWPMAVWLTLRVTWLAASRGRQLAAVLFLLVLSFCATVAAMENGHQNEAFYLTPYRAWELLVGASLAFGAPWLSAWKHERRGAWLTTLGIAALLGSAGLLSSSTPFPGLAALMPVGGAAALVVGTAWNRTSPAFRLLSSSPFQVIGKWSYAWYLWHWPMLVIARTVRGPDTRMDIAVLLASLALAGATVRFIESPFRFRWRPQASYPTVITMGLVGTMVSIAAFSSVGLRARAQSVEFTRAWRAPFDPRPDERPACYRLAPAIPNPFEACRFNPAADDMLVVWGDSHAEMWMPLALELATSGHPFAVTQATKMGCQPFVSELPSRGVVRQTADCRSFNAQIIRDLRASVGLRNTTVLLAARWTYFAEAPTLSWEERRAGDGGSRNGDTAVLRSALTETLDSLATLHVRVTLMHDVPELRYSAPECLLRWKRAPEACSVSRDDADSRLRAVRQVIDHLALEYPNVRVVDPILLVCDARQCSAGDSTRVLYKDDDHLSANSARAMRERLTARDVQWLAPAPSPAILPPH